VGVSSNNIDKLQHTVPAPGREAALDRLLQSLFQQVVDEPLPRHLIALVDQLDAAAPQAR